VVVPIPASEKVVEGMKFEDLIWSLVTLLLERGSIGADKLASFEMEMREALKKLLSMCEQEQSSLR